MSKNTIIPKLQASLEKIRNAAKAQREAGNDDIADYFERGARGCENLIFDIAAMLLQNPDLTEADIRKYILDFADRLKDE